MAPSKWLNRIAVGVVIAVVPCAAMQGATAHASAAARERLNVLFIAVDDLRPLLRCYGHDEMVTPSLDSLAREGRRFDHHYVQVPTCGASRYALLNGQYPSRPDSYGNEAFEATEETNNDPPSLPLFFRRNGYTTVSIGKITHSPDGMRADGTPELPFAWDDVGVPRGVWADGWAAFFAYAGGKTRVVGSTSVSERADVPDSGYPDGLIADAAIAKLRQLKSRPFFLAVGFFKPHLPFNAPRRYWDLYESHKLPPPPNLAPPKNVDPAVSLHKSGEMLGRYTGFAKPDTVADDEARHLRHAYRACVSYVDAQIGRVLSELKRLGLDKNTIVIVWGDHGWHLGEHGVWGKHTLHEVAMQSPLLVRFPNISVPGVPAEGLVESVDIYPTLAELCGLSPPRNLVGTSFVPMLNDPTATGKPAVYGFWRNGRGHSIRTPRYRLVSWTGPHDQSHVVQTELYDEHNDPQEANNIADRHPKLVEELTSRLRNTIPLLRKQ